MDLSPFSTLLTAIWRILSNLKPEDVDTMSKWFTAMKKLMIEFAGLVIFVVLLVREFLNL